MGSDSLALPPKLWLEVLQTELTPMTAHFAHKLASAKREANLHAPALRASLKLLSKALLHYLPALASEPGFPEMWAGLLQLLQVRTLVSRLTEFQCAEGPRLEPLCPLHGQRRWRYLCLIVYSA